MPAPREIGDLVSRFEQQLETYKSGTYNETQLRRDFLDPFFRALGWDVDNAGGYAEAYRDVIHEDAIRIGGAVKAPDYCFRVGGTRKFFVEAKKPQVRVREEVPPAYQLAKVPIRVIDQSKKPDKAVHDNIVTLVDRMLTINQQFAAAKTPHEKTALERQITATDAEIDRLVYQLYGLTENEIRIVEGRPGA